MAELDALYCRQPGPLILDSGCGTGESSRYLALQHPTALVIGIDKSAHRLARAAARRDLPPNVAYLRADLVDCWRHIAMRRMPLLKHYLLYPNPWPRQRHLMRRWHAHPLMPVLLGLAPALELRTNWRIYAEEFAASAGIITGRSVTVERFAPAAPISAFEKKYQAAGHVLYRVSVTRPPENRPGRGRSGSG